VKDAEYIEQVIRALRRVPPKHLLIIELANRYTKDGKLDYEALAEIQPEIDAAIVEAKMYGAHTMRAVNALEQLEAISSDV